RRIGEWLSSLPVDSAAARAIDTAAVPVWVESSAPPAGASENVAICDVEICGVEICGFESVAICGDEICGTGMLAMTCTSVLAAGSQPFAVCRNAGTRLVRVIKT